MLITKKRTVDELTILWRKLNAREEYMVKVIHAGKPLGDTLRLTRWTVQLRSAVAAMKARQLARGAQ